MPKHSHRRRSDAGSLFGSENMLTMGLTLMKCTSSVYYTCPPTRSSRGPLSWLCAHILCALWRARRTWFVFVQWHPFLVHPFLVHFARRVASKAAAVGLDRAAVDFHRRPDERAVAASSSPQSVHARRFVCNPLACTLVFVQLSCTTTTVTEASQSNSGTKEFCWSENHCWERAVLTRE